MSAGSEPAESSRVTFHNSRGYRLVGIITPPPGRQPPHPVVVFSHGFDSSKDSPRGLVVAEALERAGLATLRIDFTGHGESEGVKDESTIAQQTDDLISALDALDGFSSELDLERIGASGASSGAVVALAAAGRDERIRALALRSPSPRAELPELATRVRAPTLIVETDEPLLLASSERLCASLAGESRLEVIAGAGHLFEGLGSLEQMAALVSDWFARWLLGAETAGR